MLFIFSSWCHFPKWYNYYIPVDRGLFFVLVISKQPANWQHLSWLVACGNPWKGNNSCWNMLVIMFHPRRDEAWCLPNTYGSLEIISGPSTSTPPTPATTLCTTRTGLVWRWGHLNAFRLNTIFIVVCWVWMCILTVTPMLDFGGARLSWARLKVGLILESTCAGRTSSGVTGKTCPASKAQSRRSVPWWKSTN